MKELIELLMQLDTDELIDYLNYLVAFFEQETQDKKEPQISDFPQDSNKE